MAGCIFESVAAGCSQRRVCGPDCSGCSPKPQAFCRIYQQRILVGPGRCTTGGPNSESDALRFSGDRIKGAVVC